MDEILDKMLENTRFTTNTIKICFLPQRIGLGYKYTPPVRLELRKTLVKRKKKDRNNYDESSEKTMDNMLRKKVR